LAGLFTVAADFESGRDCSSWLLYTLSGAWDGANTRYCSCSGSAQTGSVQPNRLHITAESFVMKLSNEKGPK